MYRVRVVFNGEYLFYSTAKATKLEVTAMIEDMKHVLVHAVSVQLQESSNTYWGSVRT